MQNQRRKKESDLLRKTNKLPKKQPTKEQSPHKQRTNSGLRVVKTDDYAEGHAGQALTRNGYTSV